MSRLLLPVACLAVLVAGCELGPPSTPPPRPGGGAAGLTADAGEDFSVTRGEAPRFDACGSTGPITNYRWTIVSAPAGREADVGKVIREVEPACAFTLEEAMGLDDAGRWVVRLEVADAAGHTVTDTVTVDIVP